MFPKRCFTHQFYLVFVDQTDLNQFTVTYGQQVIEGLNYSQAATNLGSCLLHAAACYGHLDNSGVDE